MKFFQLKCPPPIVMFGSAIIAGLISQTEFSFLQQQAKEFENLLWPMVFIITGLSIALAGVKEFSLHQTTVNPLEPNKSSTLVTSGIYQLTRPPMYLGMLIVLLGWGDLLNDLLAFSGALIFFIYISIFQIKPEEEVMKEKFGHDFVQYCSKVRRWL